MVLLADESDDNPLTLFTAVCSKCSTLHPTDQLLTDWAERLAERRCPGDKVQWQDYVGVYLRMPTMIRPRSISPAVFTGCSGPSWDL